MTYTSHILFPLALGAGIVSAGYLPSSDLAGNVLLFSGTLCGALLPDIDHSESALGRRIKPVSMLVQALAGHRGITHTPAFWLALTVIVFAIAAIVGGQAPFFAAGLSFGYASHLFLDYLTKGGIPAAWPVKSIKARYSLGLFKTGSIFEYLFTSSVVGLSALAIMSLN